MFLFSDPTLLAAVVAASKRGVKVRVMLNPARRSGEEENVADPQGARQGRRRGRGQQSGVRAHAREVDGRRRRASAFVKSLNWETRNLTETRDYAVVTRDPAEVAEIVAGFDADWQRKPFDPGGRHEAHLVQRERSRAHRALHRRREALAVGAERALPGQVIIERLVRAVRARRQGARDGAGAAHAQEGQADRGRRRPAHPAGRRRQGAQAQGPAAARQDAAGRRQARRSSARSTSRRAASTIGASSRSRPTIPA